MSAPLLSRFRRYSLLPAIRRCRTALSRPVDPGASRDFLTTVAQISAALLSLVVTGVTAYIVFFQDHATPYFEQIKNRQADIQATLRSWPSSERAVPSFLPVEFEGELKSRFPSDRQAEIVKQAAIDLIFRGPHLTESLNLVGLSGIYEGPTRGRLYVWVLKEATDLFTGMGPNGTLRNVFPAVLEPGFDQWRRDFEHVAGTLRLLEWDANAATIDAQAYARTLDAPRRELVANLFASTITTFFARLGMLQTSVDDIARQESLVRSFDLDTRLSLTTLAILIGSAFLLGVVGPLLILANGQPLIRATAGGVIAASFGSVIVASIYVVSGAVRAPAAAEYVVERWYQPVLEHVRREAQKLPTAGLVDTELQRDMAASIERAQMPRLLGVAVDEYIRAAVAYNAKASALNLAIIQSLRDDPVLGSLFSRPGGSETSTGLWAAEILDAEAVRTRVAAVVRDGQTLVVTTSGPTWTREEFHISADVLQPNQSLIVSRFETIRSRIIATLAVRELSEARSVLETAVNNLTAILQLFTFAPNASS